MSARVFRFLLPSAVAVFGGGCGLLLGAGSYEVGDSATTEGSGTTSAGGASGSASTSATGGQNGATTSGSATTSGTATTTSTGSATTSSGTTTTSSASTGSGGPLTVVVTPDHVTLLADQFYSGFKAAVTGSANTTVAWTIDEVPNGGTIDASTSNYFASLSAGTFHIRATSQADMSVSGASIVTVVAGAADNVAASNSAIAYAVGLPHQNHLVFIDAKSQWWFFYLDSAHPAAIESVFSGDFQTWTAGPQVPFDASFHHNGQGENFALAAQTLGSSPVAHFVYTHADLVDTTGNDDPVVGGTCSASSGGNYIGGAAQARAVFGAGTFAPSAPVELVCTNAQTPPYPDGPSAAFIPGTGGAQIEIATGYTGTGAFFQAGFDTDPTQPSHDCGFEDGGLFESNLDTGGGQFDPSWSTDVSWCVPGTATSRQLLWDGTQMWYFGTDGEPVLYGWRISAEHWDHTNYMGQGLTPPAYPDGTSQQASDWMAAKAGSSVHIVRRNSDTGTYEHVIGDPQKHTFSTGGGISSSAAGPSDSGLYLASRGGGLLLFVLANTTNHPLRYTRWDGTTWSGWHTLLADTGNASHLAGYTSPVDGRIGLVWQTTTPGSAIQGLMLP